MKFFENAYISVKAYYDANPSVDILEYPLSQFGEWLDIVSNAELFNVVYENALDGLFDYACTMEEEVGFDISRLEFLITSFKSITSSTTTNEWETELGLFQPLKDKIMELKDTEGAMDALFDVEEDTNLTEIGALIDDLIEDGSIILSEYNIKEFFKNCS